MSAKIEPTGRKFKDQRDINVWEPLIILAVFVVVMGYGIIAFSTRNPTWFLPNNFTARPSIVEVYADGERQLLSPGSAAYEALVGELNAQMTDLAGYDEIRMSPRTVENALAEYTTVVLIYDEPIRINTQWALGEPDRILIPVTGTNSGDNKIYTGTDIGYGHGALILADLSEFYASVQEIVEG